MTLQEYMNPQKTYEEIKRLLNNNNDAETTHRSMEDLMCKILSAEGHTGVVDIFKKYRDDASKIKRE